MDIDAVLQYLATEIMRSRQYEDETARETLTSTLRRYPSRKVKKEIVMKKDVIKPLEISEMRGGIASSE